MIQNLLHNLNIDPVLLLGNAILFVILLAVLNAMFWKPMMRHLEQRKHDIENAYKTVDDTRREMENLRAEYQQRLAAIEAEARGQIQATVRDAQQQREQLIAEARQRVEQLQQQGQADIEEDKMRTLAAMRQNLDAVAFDALTRATGGQTDPAQRKLIDEFITRHALRQ